MGVSFFNIWKTHFSIQDTFFASMKVPRKLKLVVRRLFGSITLKQKVEGISSVKSNKMTLPLGENSSPVATVRMPLLADVRWILPKYASLHPSFPP